MDYIGHPLAISQSQSLLSTYDNILPQIQIRYINCTQAYIKPEKTSKASRYNKLLLINYKPTDRKKTLKKLLLSCGEKPPKKLRTTNQHSLHTLK